MSSKLKFINLKTGKVYNGDPNYTQSGDIDYDNSFIHWFDGQQSTDIIYVQKICILSDSIYLRAYLPTIDNNERSNNNIFKLINPSVVSLKQDNIRGTDYYNISDMYAKNDTYISEGVQDSTSGRYVHMLYIYASSANIGEYTELIKIDTSDNMSFNEMTSHEIIIGIDVYDKVPELGINLGNMGVDLPDQIIKAIYQSNYKDEAVDYTLLNRKYKELLMDFIDILANKGSYNSLLRSLDWFEFPQEMLELKEFWSKDICGRQMYMDADFEQIMTDNIKSLISSYTKSTYLGLFCALQDYIKDEDGSLQYETESDVFGEPIPNIYNKSFELTIEDLSVKLALLGNFYETYFMPIHLDLIMSTIEDVVYTTAIKLQSHGDIVRSDFVIQTSPVECNIKNGSVFSLTNIHAQANNSTSFVNKYTDGMDYSTYTNIGVSVDNIDTIKDEEELKTFMLNYYKGIGVIIPINLKVPAVSGDCIYGADINMYNSTNGDNAYMTHIDQLCIYDDSKKCIDINFNLLCSDDAEYKLCIQLKGNSGQQFIKIIKFTVLDERSLSLKLYSIKSDSLDTRPGKEVNKYMFSHLNSVYHPLTQDKSNINEFYYSQFLPIFRSTKRDIVQSHLIVFKYDNGGMTFDDYLNNTKKAQIISTRNILNMRYTRIDEDWAKKPLVDESGQTSDRYIMYLSNSGVYPMNFVTDSNLQKYFSEYIYRTERIFVPQYYKMIELDRDENVIVDPRTVLCVEPNVSFLKNIEECEWEFVNKTTKYTIKLPSILCPIIADIDYNESDYLKPGIYDIRFNYRLRGSDPNDIKTMTLQSAFIQQGEGDEELDLNRL